MTTQMTRSGIEATVNAGISRIEKEFMGRIPRDIGTILMDDLVLVRLQGVLTQAERHLVQSVTAEEGKDLLKKSRFLLLESARPALEELIHESTGVKVQSMHYDISTVTGEKIIIFTLVEPISFPESNE